MPRATLAERTIQTQINRILRDIASAKEERMKIQTIIDTLETQVHNLEDECDRHARTRIPTTRNPR
jgi:polyhydroxyalkanoate synthesis regulator phasin